MNLLIRSAFIVIAIIVIVAAVLLMFSGPQEETSVRPEQTQQKSTTLPNGTINDTTEKPERPLSLSPGHARVEITIMEIRDGNLTAEVHRVLGYGSSTKPVSSGRRLNISADTYLKNSSVDTTALKDERRQATISFKQHPSLGESPAGSEWVLVELDD